VSKAANLGESRWTPLLRDCGPVVSPLSQVRLTNLMGQISIKKRTEK